MFICCLAGLFLVRVAPGALSDTQTTFRFHVRPVGEDDAVTVEARFEAPREALK